MEPYRTNNILRKNGKISSPLNNPDLYQRMINTSIPFNIYTHYLFIIYNYIYIMNDFWHSSWALKLNWTRKLWKSNFKKCRLLNFQKNLHSILYKENIFLAQDYIGLASILCKFCRYYCLCVEQMLSFILFPFYLLWQFLFPNGSWSWPSSSKELVELSRQEHSIVAEVEWDDRVTWLLCCYRVFWSSLSQTSGASFDTLI